MPTEGKLAGKPRAGTLAYDDVPTCAPAERLTDVRSRLGETPWDVCVAVVDDRVVQGIVRLDQHMNDDSDVQQIMDADVRTFRPYADPKAVFNAMDRSEIDVTLVTTSAGQLLGAVRRADVAQAVESEHASTH